MVVVAGGVGGVVVGLEFPGWNVVVVLAAVGVVDVEVAWQWNVVVGGVVNCKLPVEVGCVEVARTKGWW